MFMNPDTSLRLAKTIQFDIKLYFFCRTMEDMEKMRKTDVRVHTDPKTLQKYYLLINIINPHALKTIMKKKYWPTHYS